MGKSFVTPPPAAPGDRVAVIAPFSGAASYAPNGLSLACDRLREYDDLEPVIHLTARQRDDFLRARPAARAAAIHEASRDTNIAAIFATIGGEVTIDPASESIRFE